MDFLVPFIMGMAFMGLLEYTTYPKVIKYTMTFGVVVMVLSMALLTGCTTSPNDHSALERRVKKLERENVLIQARLDGLPGQKMPQEPKTPSVTRACPSPPIAQNRLQHVLTALGDEANKDKFDTWNSNPLFIEATFNHEGTYYKVSYVIRSDPDASRLGFWERTDRPFKVGSADNMESITYHDQGLDGCINFGLNPDPARPAPGKMQWDHDGDPNYDWEEWGHNRWQEYYYLKGVKALSTILGLEY